MHVTAITPELAALNQVEKRVDGHEEQCAVAMPAKGAEPRVKARNQLIEILAEQLVREALNELAAERGAVPGAIKGGDK